MAKKSVVLKIFLFVSLIVLSGCANQLPPSGGEPDTIPPEVVRVFPAEGTINFNDKTIEIEFSEYVIHSNEKEAVFISPALKEKADYSWSGRTLVIELDEKLLENTTYTITVGTAFQDNNNRNNLAEPYVFAFSTGDKIDKGMITGKVYDRNPSGIVITAYRINDSIPNPKIDKPEYISQAGAKGEFKLAGLSPATYRVFALRDDFKDFLYKVEQDEYSAPVKDVVISGDDTLVTNLKFMMAREDSTLPELNNITMTDRYHLLLEFSEFIDSSSISVDSIIIADSTDGSIHNPVYFYKGKASAKQYYAAISDSLDPEHEYYMTIKGVKDYAGGTTEETSMSFVAGDRPDSTNPGFASIVSDYMNNMIDFENPGIKIVFDDGINSGLLEPHIKFYDGKDKVYKTEISFPDDASVEIKVEEKLEPRSNYRLEINMNYLVDLAGNKTDSVHVINFTTSSELDFSGISGLITGSVSDTNLVVVAEEAKLSGKKLHTSVKNDGSYEFRQVTPGEYIVWVFEDKNNNNKYDNGSIEPFCYAEPFSYYPDTLNLRPRWPVGEVNIELD